jgi:hypothetical protein
MHSQRRELMMVSHCAPRDHQFPDPLGKATRLPWQGHDWEGAIAFWILDFGFGIENYPALPHLWARRDKGMIALAI